MVVCAIRCMLFGHGRSFHSVLRRQQFPNRFLKIAQNSCPPLHPKEAKDNEKEPRSNPDRPQINSRHTRNQILIDAGSSPDRSESKFRWVMISPISIPDRRQIAAVSIADRPRSYSAITYGHVCMWYLYVAT